MWRWIVKLWIIKPMNMFQQKLDPAQSMSMPCNLLARRSCVRLCPTADNNEKDMFFLSYTSGYAGAKKKACERIWGWLLESPVKVCSFGQPVGKRNVGCATRRLVLIWWVLMTWSGVPSCSLEKNLGRLVESLIDFSFVQALQGAWPYGSHILGPEGCEAG